MMTRNSILIFLCLTAAVGGYWLVSQKGEDDIETPPDVISMEVDAHDNDIAMVEPLLLPPQNIDVPSKQEEPILQDETTKLPEPEVASERIETESASLTSVEPVNDRVEETSIETEDADDEDDADDLEEEDEEELLAVRENDLRIRNEEREECCGWGLERWTLKLRAAAFFPVSENFRKSYRTVNPNIDVEGSIKFARDMFELWGNINSFFQRGSHKNFPNGSKRVGNIVNFSLGIKFSYRVSGPLELYFGIGPSFAWKDIWIDPNAPSEHYTFRGWAFGGVFKSGIYYYINPHVFIDVFADYLYQPVYWRNRTIDIGGLKLGTGVGVSF